MLRRCILLFVTMATAWAIPKYSAKRELQRLARLPKLEFSAPLRFERGFGFVAFPDAQTAALDVARLLKEVKPLPEHARVYLEAARIYDGQGDVGGALRHYSRAIDLFRRRLEIAPRDGKALAGLGEALAAAGRFAEAQSTLDRTGELEPPTVEMLLATARFARERAWFSAAGEARRYSTTAFLDQLVAMAANGPVPSRIDESKRFLAEAERALEQAFELEGNSEERLLERAAFRSFKSAMETAFAQIQNGELRARALRLSIFDAGGLADLREAARSSDDPGVIAASALAEAFAAEVMPGERPAADAYVRRMANRLREMSSSGGESAAAAAEFLGSIQFHLLEDASGAQRTLRQALAGEPRRYRSWEILTLAAARESPEQFVETAEDRVTRLPNARSTVLLIKSYDMRGDHLRAEWTALNAANSYPNDFLVNLTLAAVLLKDANAESFLWRVEEALKKAEKALGPNARQRSRMDFILVKSVYLGVSGQTEKARELLQSIEPSPESQELLRALD